MLSLSPRCELSVALAVTIFKSVCGPFPALSGGEARRGAFGMGPGHAMEFWEQSVCTLHLGRMRDFWIAYPS